MAIDLTILPQPEVIETLDYEAILAALMQRFMNRWDDVRQQNPALPDYNVALLETDPPKIVLDATSYLDMLLRSRINSAAKANLVAFANGGDLDQLAAFYGVLRMDGEDDTSFRARLLIEIQGRSTGGSVYWYQAAALRADVRIKAAVVYRDRLYPIIRIAILSRENGGIPDVAMLNAVRTLVNSDRVRLVNDTIVVEAAVSTTTNIEADVWLLPNTSTEVIDRMPSVLQNAWALESGVGFDLEPSWIEARLHVPGVKKVQCITPSGVIVADSGVAIALGAIKINFKGYDY